jgi:outer membrane protein
MRLKIFKMITVIVGSMMITGSAMAQDVSSQASSLSSDSPFAYVEIFRVLSESTDGQSANVQVQELSEQKMAEIEAKNAEMEARIESLDTQLEEQQLRLQQGQNVMSAEARLSLQREISRVQIEAQRTSQDSQAEMERFTQDAEGEVQALQQQLQIEFQQKLGPVLDQIALDKQLSFIFSAGEGGLIWADQALNITQELIDTLNQNEAGTP